MTLLAVGISTFPGSTLCWRLVRDTAPPFQSGEPLERALGFVYVADGNLLVRADDPVGSGLVREGKAAFIPEAILQRQESLNQDTFPYLRIGLVVPEDAGYGAGGEVLFDSSGGSLRFLSPSGRRAIRLYRVDLAPGEEVPVPGGAAPVLMHVLAGQVGAGPSGGGGPEDLTAGQTVVTGSDGQDKTIIHSDRGATLLMAVIGEEVPEGGTGAISMALWVCPDSDGPCDLSNEGFSLWLEGEGVSLTEGDLVSHEGDLSWTDLPFGTYILSFPNDYSMEVMAWDEGTVGPGIGNTQLNYTVTLTPENPGVGLAFRRRE
jgi:hypothetical protein